MEILFLFFYFLIFYSFVMLLTHERVIKYYLGLARGDDKEYQCETIG